jgi:cobalt-zinc-cadmium efflux system protein
MISSHNHSHEHGKHEHDDDPNHSHSNHSHGHDHHNHHGEIENRKVLLIAVLLTFSFMLVEFFGGIFSRSLALISDAGHMFSDSASLFLAYFAIFISTKKADKHKTFGYKRVETITAFVNGITLVIVSLLIIKEGISRMINPVPINTNQLIGIAFIGLLVNILVAYILFKNSSHNLNIRGALIHVVGDLLGSIGAIGAGVIIMFTGWLYADPLISFFIAILILISSFGLLKDTFHLLMEGTPRHIELEKVESVILADEDIVNVHDLHIWSLDDSKIMLTGHLVINEISKSEIIVDKITRLLKNKFDIQHSTLQVETIKCEFGCN